MTHQLSRHLRVAHLALALVSVASLPAALIGQEPDAPIEVALRGPRFLRGVGPDAAPIDPAEVPALRRRVALPTGEVTLDAVLGTIARQAGVRLRYSRDVVPLDARLRLEGGRISLAAALTEVLLEADAGVDVAVTGTDQFVLVRRRGSAAVGRGSVVLGRVTDAKTAQAVPNAEVFLEGTRWRTTSDSAGRYRLAEIEVGTYTLTARRLGYTKHSRQITVRAEHDDTIDIALTSAAVKLDELVTTATGKQRRRDLGNDITTIQADSVLQTAPIRNLSDLLEHQVPGLYTQHTSGAPGDPARLRLRGLGSAFRSNDPVVIVDGMRIDAAQSEARSGNLANSSVPAPSPLDQIDPNIIDKIEVFKGPSAATLYGADAANGVIVVTTKRGKPGPTRWNAGFNYRMTDTPGQWPVGYYRFGKVPSLGYTTFCPLVETRCEVDSLVRYQALNDPEATVLGHGHANALSLSVSGGTSALQYNIAGAYGDEVGLLTLPDFEAARFQDRFNRAAPDWMRHPHRLQTWSISTNVSATLSKTMDVGLLTTLSRSEQRRTSLEQKVSVLAGTYLDRVNGVYYTPNPPSGGNGYEYFLIPNSSFIDEYYKQTTASSLNVNTGLNANWRPTSWFTASGNAGLNVVPRADEYFLASTFTATPADSGALTRGSGRSITSTLQLGGQLRKPLRWGLAFETSLGINYTSLSTLDQKTAAVGIAPGTHTLAGAKSIVASDGRTNSSVFGWYLEPRITGQRLSLSTGIRLDGGSAYGTRVTNLLGLPKLNGSWVVSEEPWFPFKALVSSLRLRGAYGQAQVQPNIADRLRLYTASQGWNPSQSQYRETLELTGLGNSVLRPERSTEFEGGVDADLLNSRVSLELTAYRKTQVDALMPVTLPVSVNGGGSTWTNIGKIRNTGVELTLGVTPVQTRALTWSTQVRYWRNNNIVVDLGPSVEANPRIGLVEGYPLQGRWAYPLVGFADANSDGVLERSEVQVGDSLVFMGRPMPAYQTTLATNLALFGGAVGFTADFSYDAGAMQVDQTAKTNWVLARALVDPSTPLIDQAAVLALDSTEYGLTQNVSTFRFNNVSVNYRAPQRIARLLGAQALTVGVQGGNLALHSSYRGKDPNVTAWRTGDAIVDTGQLPMPRTWQLSLNLRY